MLKWWFSKENTDLIRFYLHTVSWLFAKSSTCLLLSYSITSCEVQLNFKIFILLFFSFEHRSGVHVSLRATHPVHQHKLPTIQIIKPTNVGADGLMPSVWLGFNSRIFRLLLPCLDQSDIPLETTFHCLVILYSSISVNISL